VTCCAGADGGEDGRPCPGQTAHIPSKEADFLVPDCET
jgi:hypothetical protein